MEKAKGDEEDGVLFNYIPEEIVGNVLANLPLESLLRFRCVSQQWSCQISKHITKTKVQKVIVHTDQTLVFRSLDQNARVEDIEIEVDETITRNNPIVSPQIYGSCNEFLVIRVGIDLFLWNPSTRRSHGLLTYLLLTKYPFDRVIPGLCFDSENDDYKVVLGFNHRNWRERSVRVGSFKTKSWSIVEFKFEICDFKPGPTLNNYLHWWSFKEILSFDPKIDKFIKMSLPNEFVNGKGVIQGLGVLDGCLCMASEYLNVYQRKHCGVSESWEVMFKLKLNCDVKYELYSRRWLYFDQVTPLFSTYEQKRKVLIRARRTKYEQYGNFWLYDSDRKRPQVLSDEYAIILYDIDDNLSKDVAVSKLEQIAFGRAAAYNETIVRRVSTRSEAACSTNNCQIIEQEVPVGGKKVWKLKVKEPETKKRKEISTSNVWAYVSVLE